MISKICYFEKKTTQNQTIGNHGILTVNIPSIVNVLSGPMKYISLNVTEPTNVIIPDLRGTHMTKAPEAIIKAQTTPDKLDPRPKRVCLKIQEFCKNLHF